MEWLVGRFGIIWCYPGCNPTHIPLADVTNIALDKNQHLNVEYEAKTITDNQKSALIGETENSEISAVILRDFEEGGTEFDALACFWRQDLQVKAIEFIFDSSLSLDSVPSVKLPRASNQRIYLNQRQSRRFGSDSDQQNFLRRADSMRRIYYPESSVTSLGGRLDRTPSEETLSYPTPSASPASGMKRETASSFLATDLMPVNEEDDAASTKNASESEFISENNSTTNDASSLSSKKVNTKDKSASLGLHTALFSYINTGNGELKFKAGDVLDVFRKHANGWWYAILETKTSSSEGWVPSNFLSATSVPLNPE